eukprot:3594346-Pleurochrysis_carterae.AAC.1
MFGAGQSGRASGREHGRMNSSKGRGSARESALKQRAEAEGRSNEQEQKEENTSRNGRKKQRAGAEGRSNEQEQKQGVREPSNKTRKERTVKVVSVALNMIGCRRQVYARVRKWRDEGHCAGVVRLSKDSPNVAIDLITLRE